MDAARVWRCGRFELSLARPVVMGILNVTPDSFSDGGGFVALPDALARGRAIVAAGGDIVDVGGESTRPGSDEVPSAEETARVVPVIEALARELDVPVSVDTRHAEVARAALAAGASIINDVSGFRDPAMAALAAGSGVGLVVMHMLGEPKAMQAEPRYDDVVAEVLAYLAGQAAMLERAGVARERIALDPGIGFGKTTVHNLALLRELPRLAALGYPVLVGASRKSVVGAVLGEPDPRQRLEGSLAIAAWSLTHGGPIVRVHDVAATVKLARMLAAIAAA